MKNIKLFETMFQNQQNSDSTQRNWFSQAEWFCANAYRSTQKIGSEILTFKDPFLSIESLQEVSKILEGQGISEIILGAKDPNILLNLWELQSLGWRVKQMCMKPISPFEATHGLSSPSTLLHFSPDIEVDASHAVQDESEQTIYVTAVDLISSAIIERLRMRKRSWVPIETLEEYAQEVKSWWEKKGYSDVRVQIGQSDIDEVLSNYSSFFEKLEFMKINTGEKETFIARKDYVREDTLQNRFWASLPVAHLTALSESWQELQKKTEQEAANA